MNRYFNLLIVLALGPLTAGCSGSSDDMAANRAPDPGGEPRPVAVLDGPAPGSAVLPEELVDRLGSETRLQLIDVRTPEEFAAGHIPGAVNIPYDELPTRLHELEGLQAEELVVYCRTGRRAKIAEDALREAGFQNVRDLAGHMVAWTAASYPVSDPTPCC
jgi:rhodanese-related sulfurtransferase